MIKTIIFDWGGVLIDNPAEGLMQYCASSLGIEKDSLKEVFKNYEERFQSGNIAEKQLWREICQKIRIKEPGQESLWYKAVTSVFKDKKEVYALVEKLRNNGYKTGFLSNTEEGAVKYFKENNYERYFDATIFSCAEKTAKPGSRIYEVALQKLDTKAEEAIFIDDRQQYIEGAKKVGINTILFKSLEQIKEELRAFSVNV